jgi:hypothetical protein
MTTTALKLHQQAALGERIRAGIDQVYRDNGVTPTYRVNSSGHTDNADKEALLDMVMSRLPYATEDTREHLRTCSQQYLLNMIAGLPKPGHGGLHTNARGGADPCADMAPPSSFRSNARSEQNATRPKTNSREYTGSWRDPRAIAPLGDGTPAPGVIHHNTALNDRLRALGVPGFADEPRPRVNAAEVMEDMTPATTFVVNERLAKRGR